MVAQHLPVPVSGTTAVAAQPMPPATPKQDRAQHPAPQPGRAQVPQRVPAGPDESTTSSSTPGEREVGLAVPGRRRSDGVASATTTSADRGRPPAARQRRRQGQRRTDEGGEERARRASPRSVPSGTGRASTVRRDSITPVTRVRSASTEAGRRRRLVRSGGERTESRVAEARAAARGQQQAPTQPRLAGRPGRRRPEHAERAARAPAATAQASPKGHARDHRARQSPAEVASTATTRSTRTFGRHVASLHGRRRVVDPADLPARSRSPMERSARSMPRAPGHRDDAHVGAELATAARSRRTR